MNPLIRLRSHAVKSMMLAASALYDRHAVDADCLAECEEDDECCDCPPRDGIRSRIAQIVQGAARSIYFRWTTDILIRTFGWESTMQRVDTPFLSFLARRQDKTP